MQSLHFSFGGHAPIYALETTPQPPGPHFRPHRSEVTAMKTVFGLIDAGLVATIAFGVFTATADIFSISSLAL